MRVLERLRVSRGDVLRIRLHVIQSTRDVVTRPLNIVLRRLGAQTLEIDHCGREGREARAKLRSALAWLSSSSPPHAARPKAAAMATRMIASVRFMVPPFRSALRLLSTGVTALTAESHQESGDRTSPTWGEAAIQRRAAALERHGLVTEDDAWRDWRSSAPCCSASMSAGCGTALSSRATDRGHSASRPAPVLRERWQVD